MLITVLSLNIDMHSMRNDNLGISNDYWGIGLSSVIEGRNESTVPIVWATVSSLTSIL